MKIKKIGEILEGNKYTFWELDNKIENIINSNIKEIPFEGTEVIWINRR